MLYTTHYMAEAQELSDRIGIVDHGKMIALGTHAESSRSSARRARVDVTVDKTLDGMVERWTALSGVKQRLRGGRTTPSCSSRTRTRCCRGCSRRRRPGARGSTAVSVSEPNLELVFLHLTGRELRE